MDHTAIAVDIFNLRAKEYQDRFMDQKNYHHTFDLFCENIEAHNSEILEIACGPGNITQYLLKKRPDFRILGTDLAPNMLELAKVNNPTAAFQLMNCKHIAKLSNLYDGIMCGFCLPYLTEKETEKFIQDSAGLLKPNGLIYISTMEEKKFTSKLRVSSFGDTMYVNYHQADFLTKTLELNGFKVFDIQRKDYLENDGSKTIDLVIIARYKS